jgi:glycosyltransferase involved in cell wall biosynthesis
MNPITLGIIAPEFPPDIGGTASLARGYADELAKSEHVTVYSRTGDYPDRPGYRVHPVIQDHLSRDLQALRDENVDAWLALNGGLIPMVPKLKQPVFVYLHGSDFLNPWISYGSAWMERIRRPYMAAVRKSLRRASLRRNIEGVLHFFVNSERTAELARETLGIPSSKLSICAPGVDACFFQEHHGNQAQPGRLRLLTVTRLTAHSARKNVDGALEAIASLRNKVEIEYTIVGDGDDRERLEKLSTSLQIESKVTFTGRIGEEELLECYRNADLFLLAAKATIRDIEGFGIVYIEASASGVPVICSRAGGAIDAVTEGENGILIPDSSPAAIAQGIRDFADQRARYTPERARAVAENYRWERVAGQLRERMHKELGART